MASQATRERVEEKTKEEMKGGGGISAEKWTGFTDDERGKSACGRVRSRRDECV